MDRLKTFMKRAQEFSQKPIDKSHASHLLEKAELSLEKYLASEDSKVYSDKPLGMTKFGVLHKLYKALRQFDFDYKNPDFPLERLPTARDLFWDEPISDLEHACLNDAFSLSYYLRNPDGRKGDMAA